MDQWTSRIVDELEESARLKHGLKDLAGSILALAQDMHATLQAGGKIVFCGNGGSAADSQHLAAELVGMFLKDRAPLPALAFTTNTSVLTAVSNDWSYDEVFARQVRALVAKTDMVIGISAGGNSPNVNRAIEEARKIGARTAALIGKGGGKLAGLVDRAIVVPSNKTPRIQEAHITIGHIVCGFVEEWFVNGGM